MQNITNRPHRPRRLRKSKAIRDLVSQTSISSSDLVAPLFVKEGAIESKEISSLPGVFQHSIDSLHREVESLLTTGVTSVILFGLPEEKDETGSQAWHKKGIIQEALRSLKFAFGSDLVAMADTCLDEFTSHGHCGVIGDDGDVDNDKTLDLYVKMALAQAEAGADFIAPSGMMDGQVGAIRSGLDANGFSEVPIMAYSAKYASAFYGPFREAVDVTIANGGDRKSYQQDFRNSDEAINEVRLDIEEGADIVMVKPAMAYLDVIQKVSQEITVPLAAYHVSGEYSMIKAAAEKGWIDETNSMLEATTSIKRAGADIILTYFAKDIADVLNINS